MNPAGVTKPKQDTSLKDVSSFFISVSYILPCNNTGQHLQTTPKKWNHQQHLTSRRRSAVTPRHTRTASRNVIKCGWHFHCVSEKYKMPRKQINRTYLSSFSHIRFKILYYSYTAQHVKPSNLHFSDFFYSECSICV